MSRLQPLRPSARSRWTSAAAALLASAGLLAGLLGAFFHASSQPWLQPTPEVLELAALCQAKRARGDQDACLQRVLAQRTQVVSPDLRVAAAARLVPEAGLAASASDR